MEDDKPSGSGKQSHRYGLNHDSDEDDDDKPSAFNEETSPINTEHETQTVLAFCGLILDHAVKELRLPTEPEEDPMHEKQYGHCRKPFGVLRMRTVEFL